MKRIDFIKSLGIIVSTGMIIPNVESEKLTLPSHTSDADHRNPFGAERMRITSSGNVSLGCTNPSAKLVVS